MKRLSSKAYALLLSVIMLVTVSAAVLASVSENGGVSGNDNNSSVSDNDLVTTLPAPVPSTGATVSSNAVDVTPVSADMLEHMRDLLTNNRDDFRTTYNIPAVARLVASFNLTLKPGEMLPAGGLIIPIRVNEGKVGDYAIVVHRQANYIWEVVGRGLLGSDLTINTTFTSFSPVMVLVVDAANVDSSGVNSPRTDNDTE